ncbi:MAG: MFS transporter [Armatimonadota bacterium]|nr:MFS transporter [Armatimonadota bacterium]MDW8104688.1 MFS transporter [Armatimonadota bacterium]
MASLSRSLLFVVLLGLVSLLADTTYEGARSITGPFLGTLGATGLVVGFVSGLGELVGYALRLASGYLTDRTRRYWLLTFVGYTVNLLAVPLLALAGNWLLASLLIVLERCGKAIRTPARDAMLSHATRTLGHGWGFGLHEAMDQVGAVLGPLLVFATLSWHHDYRMGFAVLLVPAVLALVVLSVARWQFPRPQELEAKTVTLHTRGFSPTYWVYLSAVGLVAAGYADFPLMAYHYEKQGVVASSHIALLYALAMGADAVGALLLGRLFDKVGFATLALATLISAGFAPLAFLGGFTGAVAGATLWGIGMSAQESVMRAAVAQLVPIERRGTGFGVFHTGYGVAWFAGSALMGWLYDRSVLALVVFSVCLQAAALVVFLLLARQYDGRRRLSPS